MCATPDHAKPHSAEYFGEVRDYWWNADFLALIARRWSLDRVRTALDVGCGVGHWGRLVLPLLSPHAHMTGVDPEPRWVEAARTAMKTKGLEGRTAFAQGTVERLPFPDNHFDLVTCQTVLIHVRDTRVALREMIRVLRPGGRLWVVEPNNLASAMVTGSMRDIESLEDRVHLVRFQAICERGKERLGEGNNSVGDQIPGQCVLEGLEDVQVYLSDHATPMFPPYSSDAQRAEVRQATEWAGREFWIWDRADTRRYFLAGGGAEGEFEGQWGRALEAARMYIRALAEGTYHTGGGVISYLVSGNKSASAARAGD